MKFLLVMFIALSVWVYAKPYQKDLGRFPASEDSEPVVDEDTDYYDSYKMEHDNSKPLRPDQLQENKSPDLNKAKKKKKSKDPIGDDVEWSSQFSPEKANAGCLSGNAHDCFLLADYKQKNSANPKEYLPLYDSACKKQINHACYKLGQYSLKVGNTEYAKKYFSYACQTGNLAESCYEYSSMLLTSGKKLSYQESNDAFEYLSLACDGKIANSCYQLGKYFEANANYESSKLAYQKACQYDKSNSLGICSLYL